LWQLFKRVKGLIPSQQTEFDTNKVGLPPIMVQFMTMVTIFVVWG